MQARWLVAMLTGASLAACPSLPVESVPDGGCGPCGSGSRCVNAACYLSTCKERVCSSSAVCANERCVAEACLGISCPAGSACAGGTCHPEDCEGEACTSVEVCIDGACAARACAGIVCPADTVCAEGECVPTGCELDALCPPGQGCVEGACTDTACRGVACPPGSSCERGVCTLCAAGHFLEGERCLPVRPEGTPCTSDAGCSSGSCVQGTCCDRACDSPCESCAGGQCSPLPAGTETEGCGGYLCGVDGGCSTACTGNPDCVPNVPCVSGECLLQPKPLGTRCAVDAACDSGFCVNGTCCDGRCAGGCDRCDLPGTPGRCTPVDAGTPGSPSCGAFLCDGTRGSCPTTCDARSDCIATASCFDGGCTLLAANGTACTQGSRCLSGHCVDGYCCNSACAQPCNRCNRVATRGTCTPAMDGVSGAPSCGAYLCNGTSSMCPTSCATNSDCTSGHGCVGGKCVLRKANGNPCTDGNGCTSGMCVDEVCCNGTCDGWCDRCNLPGSVGTCTLVPDGTPWFFSWAAICCGGQPVDISTDPNHCGGCYAACATGQCQPVDQTPACSSAPQGVSGRCFCYSNLQCPYGQVCRTFTPYTNVCTPNGAQNCAPGTNYVDVQFCPNYCKYEP